jgi:hypothetical protein
MIKKDDRTEEQKTTHVWAIVARDSFMSGWGQARGHGGAWRVGSPFRERGDGVSRCAWACHPDVNTDRVFNWVKSRSEMKNVSLVDLRTYRPPANTAHFHVYVCNPEHVGARY